MTGTPSSTWQSRSLSLLSRIGNSRKLAYTLAGAAVLSGVATAATMTGTLARNYDIGTVVALLYVDGILLLMLSTVIARRMVQLWQERRRGEAGAGLHGRLVVLFSLVAVTPAILVAVFSALYLNFGIQTWFSERINTAINQSRTVANAYLHEHRNNIRADALAIANDLNYNASKLANSPYAIDNILTSHATFRSLSNAVVIDSLGKVLGRARYSLGGDTVVDVSKAQFAAADSGKIVVPQSASADQVRALMKLNGFLDSYLLVERFVDPRISRYIDRINAVVNEYNTLEKNSGKFQISFVMIFVMLALLMLMAAAWVGLTVSNQLASPISRLIRAAGDVSKGDLSVRVETSKDNDEISTLTHAFNTMTTQLETQRAGLMEANRELDERHRFTETVLSGVSAGVIGLDKSGNVHLPNRSASVLLATNMEQRIGTPLTDVIPEMADLLAAAKTQTQRKHQAEIQLIRNQETRTLHVRIAVEKLKGEIIGYVVTFDDVTDLLSAQRKAAWADVARRIAHEIKNPLTPIQLSAERLQRKYLAEITSDPDTFQACTDTIIRQVEDIGRMVDEFSSFARMPEPSVKAENLTEICRQVLFLEQSRNQMITFATDFPDQEVRLDCDAAQLSRALTNILKNASESVNTAIEQGLIPPDQGAIGIKLDGSSEPLPEADSVVARITISDNGVGLPAVPKDRLTEPYVTTRSKGTGLGLAIVKKIMEEHSGDLDISDREERGAVIILTFHPLTGNRPTSGSGKTHSSASSVNIEIGLALGSSDA